MSTNAGWELLAYIATERREHLGLAQTELNKYGGPGKSTLGKIENARQRAFPDRTLWSLEKVYGWDRGTIKTILEAPEQSWFSTFGKEAFAVDYIEAPAPDFEALERAAAGRPRESNGDEEDWPTLYNQALQFAVHVNRELPELRDQATKVMVSTSRLFDAVIAIRKGGDGDADTSGGPAPMNELQAAAEHDEMDPLEEAEETERET